MNLPRSRSDSVYWVLVIYTLGWLVSRMVADANLDPAGNMLENFAWGEYVTWGTSKHPPLMVWVTSVWFTIFPNYDAFYHLLAYLVSAIGLLGVYHLAVAVRLAPFAFSVTILLSIALPYSTLAAKFNANTVLLAVWPWVVWCWVVVIRNPSLLLSALLGFLAALAMLGKYYSGVLLLSLGFATLLDPAGRRWLFSRYSLITITIGALALAPHVLWLIHHDFPTLSYLEGKGGEDVDMNGLFRFAVAPFVFWLIPWCLVAWMFTAPGPAATRFKQWLNNLIFAWQPSVEHRTVTLLVVLPWLFSVILGAVGFVDLRSHWAIPIGFAYPLLWIANLSDRQVISVKRIVGFSRRAFFSWMALVVLLSPVYAWQQGQVGNDNYYRPRADLAGTLIDLWQEQAPGRTLSWTA
jgi:4-amino-4-deoxy-L-arabinose transferase-like glycosyltransferase